MHIYYSRQNAEQVCIGYESGQIMIFDTVAGKVGVGVCFLLLLKSESLFKMTCTHAYMHTDAGVVGGT